MRVKQILNISRVGRIKGLTSMELAENCPDNRAAFPTSPCANHGCEYAIKEAGYMNCTFVAAEAGGEHTLEAIGEMMGITREGVRLIELRAMKKIQSAIKALKRPHDETTMRESGAPTGQDYFSTESILTEYEDESDLFSDYDDRELAIL